MSRRVKGTAALVFTGVAVCGLVSSAAKPVVDMPVIATLADMAQGYVLQVGSDGGGAYINGTQGGVSSRDPSRDRWQ